ncbi:MAG TPA: type II toxin-antitoxin system RelE/ParE family toxin [Tepidisphaeraceae bacterium]|nr:type II toxin-antitoxin system RelE/ParE family toxin [Tepidisphaeraceae bacterium]
MLYQVEFRPRAVRDLQGLDPQVRRRVLAKIRSMSDDLAGDVKRLTTFTPEYRLRVGDWRVLFEVADQRIIVHRVRRRDAAYDG